MASMFDYFNNTHTIICPDWSWELWNVVNIPDISTCGIGWTGGNQRHVQSVALFNLWREIWLAGTLTILDASSFHWRRRECKVFPLDWSARCSPLPASWLMSISDQHISRLCLVQHSAPAPVVCLSNGSSPTWGEARLPWTCIRLSIPKIASAVLTLAVCLTQPLQISAGLC